MLSFPSLVNVVSLLGLIVFIYAVLGVVLFTFIAHGEHYTDQRNFVTIGNAFLTLFQCITGDGWAGLMMDGMIDESSGLCTRGGVSVECLRKAGPSVFSAAEARQC